MALEARDKSGSEGRLSLLLQKCLPRYKCGPLHPAFERQSDQLQNIPGNICGVITHGQISGNMGFQVLKVQEGRKGNTFSIQNDICTPLYRPRGM